MSAPAVAAGPRIYNLFPLLCGPIKGWHDALPNIAAMGFDWIYLNPFHFPGFSGSLYAVKDYYRLNPLIRGDAPETDDDLLRGFVAAARGHGLRVMMDLVVNHTAKDSVLVEQHPNWFGREADGSVRSPRAIDPSNADNVTIWGDLGELDYADAHIRTEITAYWRDLVRHYLGLGFAGFRCDAAYMVPTEVWGPLIADAREVAPGAQWFAETLGCRLEQVQALAGAGFDFLFNSVKWWDLQAPWALDQYEMFRHIAPSVGFPESHDTERLAHELSATLHDDAAIGRMLVLRYAVAACFSTGVLMPVGYEFGFRRRLDVVQMRQSDWEAQHCDIGPEIGAINRMKAGIPALNQEGPQMALPCPDGASALLRRTEDGSSMAIFACNPGTGGTVSLDLAAALSGHAPEAASPETATWVDATPGAPPSDHPLRCDLGPLGWRLFRTA